MPGSLEDVGFGRPLLVPLATDPFRRYERGSKWVEVRQDAPRWGPRHVQIGRPVLLRRGYSTRDEIARFVGRVWRGEDVRSVPEWVVEGADVDDWLGSRFFDPSRPLVAFEVLRR